MAPLLQFSRKKLETWIIISNRDADRPQIDNTFPPFRHRPKSPVLAPVQIINRFRYAPQVLIPKRLAPSSKLAQTTTTAKVHDHPEFGSWVSTRKSAWEDDGKLETKNIAFAAPRSGDREYAGFRSVVRSAR
jgi:hypothetical protein